MVSLFIGFSPSRGKTAIVHRLIIKRGNEMTDLFAAPIRKTIAGRNVGDLLDAARVVETRSGDYLVRVGDLELDLTDDYDMSVSDFGTCLGIMILSADEVSTLEALHKKTEELYGIQASGFERDSASDDLCWIRPVTCSGESCGEYAPRVTTDID